MRADYNQVLPGARPSANQVDVGGHRTGNLLGGVSIFIDVAKDFIAVIFSVALEAHRRLQKASSLGLPGLR